MWHAHRYNVWNSSLISEWSIIDGWKRIHSASQRSDGLFGAIVVRAYNDINLSTYDVDSPHHVIVINDWENQISIAKVWFISKLYMAFKCWNKSTAFEKFADFQFTGGDESINSILVNGRGVEVNPELIKPGHETPRSVFAVKQGLRFRFRIVNAGILYCPIEVSIDNHLLAVIAVDGK